MCARRRELERDRLCGHDWKKEEETHAERNKRWRLQNNSRPPAAWSSKPLKIQRVRASFAFFKLAAVLQMRPISIPRGDNQITLVFAEERMEQVMNSHSSWISAEVPNSVKLGL